MSLFMSDEKEQMPENIRLDSPVQNTDGAFQEQKGLMPAPKPSIDYNMDLYRSMQDNADSLYEYLGDNEKDLNYIDMIDRKSSEMKQVNKKKYSGLMANLFDAVKHPGSIIQRITSKAIPESLIEGAMNTETYRRTLSIMQTAGDNPDEATNILTSDSVINYIKGQADYLDNSMYEMYRNSDYRYLLNSAGLTGGLTAATFLGGVAAGTVTAGLSGTLVASAASAGSIAVATGAAVTIGSIISGAIIPALAVGGLALAGSLIYSAYKKHFDKDPYDDKSIGYNKDTQTIIDEFGEEEGLRMLASQNLRSISDILVKIKKLDRQSKNYKQRRKEMLNTVNVLANDISSMTTEFSGTPYGSIDTNSEIISVLKNAGFATAKVDDFILRKSNEYNKATEIKNEFGVKGTSTNVIKGYEEAKAKAERKVVSKYFGGSRESFLGEKLKHPDKIEAMIKDVIPEHLSKEINEADDDNFIPASIIADNTHASIFKDKQGITLKNLKSRLEKHILSKADGIADNMAIKNLTSLYHRMSRENKTPDTIEVFIKNNLQRAKKAVMPYAIQFSQKIVEKDIKAGNFVLPDGSNTQYLETKPGAPKQSTYGLTIEDENMVSEINDELYSITNENTLRDYLGEKRTKKIDPLYRTPKFKKIINDVGIQLHKFRKNAIETYQRNHAFNKPETLEEMQLAEKEAKIPESYRIGNKEIDEALALKVAKENFDPKDFEDPNDPFRKIEHIHETFSTLAPLSDDALEVVKKHLIRSYANNKVREEDMKKSDEFDYKINLVQQKRYKDLITINWINDLKYLRKAFNTGDFSGSEDIFGKDEMPKYWSSRYESWKEDFLLGKIFGIRRTGSFAGRADISASNILEIQKLEHIRKAFINKFGANNKVVEFIEDREDFYHNAIQHAGMATMLGKELYDRAPMFASIIAEMPYDISQMAVSGAVTKGLMTGVSKVKPIGNKQLSYMELWMNAVKKAFISDPHNKHAGTATGPIFRLAKHIIGQGVNTAGVMSKIKANAMIKATFKKILSDGGPDAVERAQKYIMSYLRQDVGKEAANKVAGYIAKLTKHGGKRISQLSDVSERIISKEKAEVVNKFLNNMSGRITDWIDERHWTKGQSWFEELLHRDPRNSSYVTKEVLNELTDFSKSIKNNITKTGFTEETITELADTFEKIIQNIGTTPSDATFAPKLLNKIAKMVLRKQKYKELALIEELLTKTFKNNAILSGEDRSKIYINTLFSLDLLEKKAAEKNQTYSSINNIVKIIDRYFSSDTIKKLSESQNRALDKTYYKIIRHALDKFFDMNEDVLKYFDEIAENRDIVININKIKTRLSELFGEIERLSQTEMTDAKKISLSNTFLEIRKILSGQTKDGKIPSFTDDVTDIFAHDSELSLPKLMDEIYTLHAQENTNSRILERYKKYIQIIKNKHAGKNLSPEELEAIAHTKLSKDEIATFKNAIRIKHAGTNADKKNLAQVTSKIKNILAEVNDTISTSGFTIEEIAEIQKTTNKLNLWKGGNDYLNNPLHVSQTLNEVFKDALLDSIDGKPLTRTEKRDLLRMLNETSKLSLDYKYLYSKSTPGGQNFNFESVLHAMSSIAFKEPEDTSKVVGIIDNWSSYIKDIRSKSLTKLSADYDRDLNDLLRKASVMSKINRQDIKDLIIHEVLGQPSLEKAKKFAKEKAIASHLNVRTDIDNPGRYIESIEKIEDELNRYVKGTLKLTEKQVESKKIAIAKFNKFKSESAKYDDLYNMLNNETLFDARISEIIDLDIEHGLTIKDVGDILFGVDTGIYDDIQRDYVKNVSVPDFKMTMLKRKKTYNGKVNIISATARPSGDLVFTDAVNISESSVVKELAKQFEDTANTKMLFVNTKKYSAAQFESLITSLENSGYSFVTRGSDESGVLFISKNALGGKEASDVIYEAFHGMTNKQIKKLKYADKVIKRTAKIFSGGNQLDQIGLMGFRNKSPETITGLLPKIHSIENTEKANEFLKQFGIGWSKKISGNIKQTTEPAFNKYIKRTTKKLYEGKNAAKSIFTEEQIGKANSWIAKNRNQFNKNEINLLNEFIREIEDNIILTEYKNNINFLKESKGKMFVQNMFIDEEKLFEHWVKKYGKNKFDNYTEEELRNVLENILGNDTEMDGAVLEGRLHSVFRRGGQNRHLYTTNKTQVISTRTMSKENSARIDINAEEFIDDFLDSLGADESKRFRKGGIANVYFKKSFSDMTEFDKNGKEIKSFSIAGDKYKNLPTREARIKTATELANKNYVEFTTDLDDFYYLENLQVDPRSNPQGKLGEAWGIFGDKLGTEQKGIYKNGGFVTPVELELSKLNDNNIRSIRRASNLFPSEYDGLMSEAMIEKSEHAKDELFTKTIPWFKDWLTHIGESDSAISSKIREFIDIKKNASVSQTYNAINKYIKGKLLFAGNDQNAVKLVHANLTALFSLSLPDANSKKLFKEILSEAGLPEGDMYVFFKRMSELIHPMNHSNMVGADLAFDSKVYSKNIANNLINSSISKAMAEPGQYLTLTPDMSMLAGRAPLKDFESIVPPSFRGLGYEVGDELIMTVFPTESSSRLVKIRIAGFANHEGALSLNARTTRLLARDYDGDGVRLYYRPVGDKVIGKGFGKPWLKEIVERIDAAHEAPGFNFMSETNWYSGLNEIREKTIKGIKLKDIATKILSENKDAKDYADLIRKEIYSKGLDEYEAMKIFGKMKRLVDVDSTAFVSERAKEYANTEWKTFLEFVKDGYEMTPVEDFTKQFSEREKNVIMRNLVGAVDNDSEGVFTLINFLKHFTYKKNGNPVMIERMKTLIDNELAEIGINSLGYKSHGGQLKFLEGLIATALQSSIDMMNGGVNGKPINLRQLMAFKRSGMLEKTFKPLGKITADGEYINPARQIKDMLLNAIRQYDDPDLVIKAKGKEIFNLKKYNRGTLKNFIYYVDDKTGKTMPARMLDPYKNDLSGSFNPSGLIKSKQEAYRNFRERLGRDKHMSTILDEFEHLTYMDKLVDDIPLENPTFAKAYGFVAGDPEFRNHERTIGKIAWLANQMRLNKRTGSLTPAELLSVSADAMKDVDEHSLFRLAEKSSEKLRAGEQIRSTISRSLSREFNSTGQDIADVHRTFSRIGRPDITADFFHGAKDRMKVQLTKDHLGGDVLVNREKNVLINTAKAAKQRRQGFDLIEDLIEMGQNAQDKNDRQKYFTMAGEALADLQATFKNINDDILKVTAEESISEASSKYERVLKLFEKPSIPTIKNMDRSLYKEFYKKLLDQNPENFNISRDVIEPFIRDLRKGIADENIEYGRYIFDGFRNHEILNDVVRAPQLTVTKEGVKEIRKLISNSKGGTVSRSKIQEFLKGTKTRDAILKNTHINNYVTDQMPTSNYWRQLAHSDDPAYINQYIKLENKAMEFNKAVPTTANRNVLRSMATSSTKNASTFEHEQAINVLRAAEDDIVKNAKEEMRAKLGIEARKAVEPITELHPNNAYTLDDDLYKKIKQTHKKLKNILDPATKELNDRLYLMIGKEVGEGVTSNLSKRISQFVALYKAFKLSLPGGGLRFVVFNGIENTYKTLLYMMDNINDGYQLKASSILDVNRYKGNANEIISHLMFFDDLGKGFKSTDPNKLWRTIEGSRTINLYNKISANTEHMFSKNTSKWYGRMLDNLAKVNSRYLQWTGDNFETPFRNKVFADKFMREFVKASAMGHNPNTALQEAAKLAWKTTDEIFFDYANKIGAFSGANQILYPFGDFRFKNASYWSTQFANNPLLLRSVMHTLPFSHNTGKDPRQGKFRVPATDMYINPYALLSFNDFMRHTVAKPAFALEKQRKYELLYKKVKGLPEEEQRAFAFRQKDGPEVMAYFQYRHVKPFAQMFRVLDDYLGMSSIAKGTANTIAGLAFNGRMFKPDDYKGEYGALLELVNAWFPGKDVNQPIGLMRLLSPQHTKYLKKQSARKVKSAMKTMNMTEEEAKAYVISIERWRQALAFVTGMFPTVVTEESANYMKQISSWKKTVKPYADDTHELQSYLLSADLPDTSAYRLFDSTRHALENVELYGDKVSLIPVEDMGKISYLPIVNLKDDATDAVTLHVAAAQNPFYKNDYKNVVDTTYLEKAQYVEFGLNASRYLKDEAKEEFFHRRGLSNTDLHSVYKRYFNKNKYESLKTAREYLRSQSGGVPYIMLDEDAIEDMEYVDRLESRIKDYSKVTPSTLDSIKHDYPKWAYDYAAKRYAMARFNDIDWTEPDRHAVKGLLNLLGKKNYLNIAAGFTLSKDYGKEIKDLSTFSNPKDINTTAYSPSKMSQMNPILRKKLEMYVPELKEWSQSGKRYYDRIMEQSGLSVDKLKKEKVNIPRQLETFAKNPSRKMIRQLSNKSMTWIKTHGFSEAFHNSMETGNMAFLAQQIQKYLKFRNA